MAINWLSRSQEAYNASTDWFEANLRTDVDYSLKAFRNEHASGSKYHSPEYASRSRIFRPKTRSIIRKNEAAAAVALFSNMDVVNVTPGNPDDLMNVAAAAAMKEILEYRLTRSIPAFPLVMGAMQDAQATGTVCSYNYWEYVKRDGKKIKDKPCIELRPIENIRLDNSANWLDPVGTSPYFIDILPMPVCDVLAMMDSVDDKTGQPKWKKYDEKIIQMARPEEVEAVRQSRLGEKKQDPQEHPALTDFSTVWVLRWMMKDSQGFDYTYYTLGTEKMLTDPKPLEEVYFHGKRPYTMGYAILETHKPLKTSLPMLIKPLQQETNAVANDRLDNVKFVLHKRWLVARGRQVDVQSLVRGAPGGVTLTTNPKEDIVESNWPDVTSSAYAEQDRISADLDDLAGNFTPSTKVANNAVNDTLGGSKMAAAGAGLMTDYLIRTIIETWWEPTLNDLVLLEQAYETDETILKVCGDKARMFPKFGLYGITEDILQKQVFVNVNVGMGSSNPQERFQKALTAFSACNKLIATAPPNMNVMEGVKEIMSNAGYRDGTRFYSEKGDPRLLMAKQQIQQLTQALQSKQMEIQSKEKIEQMKLIGSDRIAQQQTQTDRFRIQGDLAIRQAEVAVEQEKVALEILALQIETQGKSEEYRMKLAELQMSLEEAQMKLEGERAKLAGNAMKIAAEVEAAHLDLEAAKATARTEGKVDTAIGTVTKAMEAVNKQIKQITSELDGAKQGIESLSTVKDQVNQLGQGVSMMLHGMAKGEGRKPVKMGKKKGEDGKMVAVTITQADGTEVEIPVS